MNADVAAFLDSVKTGAPPAVEAPLLRAVWHGLRLGKCDAAADHRAQAANRPDAHRRSTPFRPSPQAVLCHVRLATLSMLPEEPQAHAPPSAPPVLSSSSAPPGASLTVRLPTVVARQDADAGSQSSGGPATVDCFGNCIQGESHALPLPLTPASILLLLPA